MYFFQNIDMLRYIWGIIIMKWCYACLNGSQKQTVFIIVFKIIRIYHRLSCIEFHPYVFEMKLALKITLHCFVFCIIAFFLQEGSIRIIKAFIVYIKTHIFLPSFSYFRIHRTPNANKFDQKCTMPYILPASICISCVLYWLFVCKIVL